MSEEPRTAFARNVETYFSRRAEDETALRIGKGGSSDLAAWFLGPKGENKAMLQEFVRQAVEQHCKDREDYFPSDPVFVTAAMKASESFQDTEKHFKDCLQHLLLELRGSIPLASYRNQSHMYWDITLPGAVGYFAAMLYNQNNVAAEASPVTTHLELQVGDDLCEMLGYKIPADTKAPGAPPRPWGHITCDGSVANTESMWASRNLKYLPVSLAAALKSEPDLEAARDFSVALPGGAGRARLIDLDSWTLLNLQVDEVLALSPRLQCEFCITQQVMQDVLAKYGVQALGLSELQRRFLSDIPNAEPVFFAPSTAHYSWPKAAALIGLGYNSLEHVHVDLDCRMDTDHLRAKLEECLEKKRPVMQVVAVIGTTEESAVDPLDEIVALRKEYRNRGLEFELHLDAAWGGYFCSMLRGEEPAATSVDGMGRRETPMMVMSDYVRRQYEAFPHADSITVDPHKSGYIPYPAGALCYRNGTMRTLVAFTAPVVYHGGLDPTVGVYGVEGSKPGAAAAGVYLSHRVIRTDRSGYGKILGKCFWNSKRLYAEVVSLATKSNDPFIVTPVQRLPAEKQGKTPSEVEHQLQYIKEQIVPKSNDELISLFETDASAWSLFQEMGSDQIIITYAFNFRTPDGSLNNDVARCNKLNFNVFQKLSLQSYDDRAYGEVPKQPMFVTQSSFDPAVYGQEFVDVYARRLGVTPKPGVAITFLISTTQDPWVTDTSAGNFIPQIGEVLRTTVISEVSALNAKYFGTA